MKDLENLFAVSGHKEVLREPTAGGIVYRKDGKNVEILLIQDAKDRWTIPKGHIEEGEQAKETAEREIKEETGLQKVQVLNWLGKINFRYRRQQKSSTDDNRFILSRGSGRYK